MPRLTFWDWLFGTLILLAGPAIVIGGLWAWTSVLDQAPQPGPLTSNIDSPLGWIDSPTTHRVLFTPPPLPGTTPTTPPPLDLLIMVDVSGSTGDYRPKFNDAVARLAHLLLDDPGRGNRIAVANFAVDANLMVNWTADPAQIIQPLPRLLTMTGENDSRAAFELTTRVIGTARPNARHAVIFYTDGYIVTCETPSCPKPLYNWNDISLASQQLRERGTELFAIGLPGTLNQEMIRVTGNAANLKTPASLADVGPLLTSIVTNSANVLSQNGTLTEQIDGRMFGIRYDPDWIVADGTVRHGVTPVITTPDTFVNQLVPRTLGLMHTGFGPVRFRYLDRTLTETVTHEAREPSVLVISPLFLLIAGFPALAWTAWCLARIRPAERLEEPVTVPFHMPPERPLAPRPLPMPPVGGPLVSTLFIGVGGWGRRALDATRRELRELHGTQGEAHWGFVAIDVDSASHPELPHDAAILLKPPPEIADTARYIDAAARSGEPYAALNLRVHLNESREQLNLANGSRGNRQLAKLVFLRWLETRAPAAALKAHLHALATMPAAPGGVRQIVILTSMAGGFGSAVTLDLARLLRRLARDEQSSFIPENIIVADATAADLQSRERRDAFLLEQRTSGRFRQHPERITFVPEDPLLDRIDAEAPSDNLLAVSGEGSDTVSQAAILCGVLVDAAPRRAMLREIDAQAGAIANVGCRALTVRHDLARRLIVEEFQARSISSLLLDSIVPKPEGGGFMPVRVSQTVMPKLLARLAANESAASPWFQLVRAADDAATLSGLLETLAQPGTGNLEWLRAAAARTLIEAPGATGDAQERIGPVQAIAVLEFIASRLRGQLKSETMAQGATAATLEVFDGLAGSLNALATDLGSWVHALVDAVSAAVAARARLMSSADSATNSLVLVGDRFNEQTIARYFAEAMEKWAASDGNRLPDEALLNFAIVMNGDRFVPLVRGRMGQRSEFNSPSDTIAAIRRVATRIVDVVPEAWLDTTIAQMDPAPAARYAARLADGQGGASGEMLVRPLAANPEVSAAVEAFAKMVRPPLGQSPRIDATGADRLMMRRVWWSEAHEPLVNTQLPLVQSIDIGAREACRQITHYLGRNVDVLPIGLSFALARQDGFIAFACAYRAGEIQPRTNAFGRDSWFLLSDGTFLTEGDTRLASAAANFVRNERLCAMHFDDARSKGDFSLLDGWLEHRGEPDLAEHDHLVTLAAIRLLGRATS